MEFELFKLRDLRCGDIMTMNNLGATCLFIVISVSFKEIRALTIKNDHCNIVTLMFPKKNTFITNRLVKLK